MCLFVVQGTRASTGRDMAGKDGAAAVRHGMHSRWDGLCQAFHWHCPRTLRHRILFLPATESMTLSVQQLNEVLMSAWKLYMPRRGPPQPG